MPYLHLSHGEFEVCAIKMFHKPLLDVTDFCWSLFLTAHTIVKLKTLKTNAFQKDLFFKEKNSKATLILQVAGT